MFKVETYLNPVEYFNNLVFHENEIHLTAVSALSVYLNEKVKLQKTGIHIFSYDKLQLLLYPKWNNPLIEVFLSSRLRYYLNNMLEYPPTIIQSMAGHVGEIVQSFRFAVELGVKQLPKLEKQSTENDVFRDLFHRMLNDQQIQPLIKERGYVDNKYLCEKLKISFVNVIYVYQFSKMDAAKMAFFHLCRNQGVQVVFRIPYSCLYPSIFKGWKEIYEKVSLTPSDSWDKTKDNPITRGNLFLEFLEGNNDKVAVQDELKINIYSFSSPVEFKRYLMLQEHQPEREVMQYVGFSTDLLNKSLRDVLASKEEQEEDNFFAYPLAKFLFFLYECKKFRGEILIKYDVFVECLTSGWIQIKGVLGTRTSTLLSDLEPYMEGVASLAEIKERLTELDELMAASKIFDHAAKDETLRSRIKKYLANPFRVFPYVLRERHTVTVKQLLALTAEMEQILIRLLPDEGEEIGVKAHLTLLNQLWSNVKALHSIPVGLASRVDKALSYSIPHDWKAARSELRQHIAVLLHLKDKENPEEKTTVQDIHNIEQLTGLVLGTEKLHITDLSMKSLINYNTMKSSIPPYLTHTWLKEACKKQFPEAEYKILCHCLLVDYTYNQFREHIIKFKLFYTVCFFTGKSLTFSWIKELHEYDNESVFMKILSSLYMDEGNTQNWKPEFDENVLARQELSYNSEEEKPNGKSLAGEIPAVSWLDMDFCALKFFFSSIVQPHPVYESDFHHRLVFATIGSLLSQQGDANQSFEDYLYPLFPQWPKALKDNLILTSPTKKLREYLQFQNVSYPRAMDSIQRLRSKYIVTEKYKIKYAYDNGVMKEKEWVKEFLSNVLPEEVKANPGRHCAMCAHLLFCGEGEYAIDRIASAGYR